MEESKAKGFTVEQHTLPDGSKSFSLKVPFDADVVMTHVCKNELYMQEDIPYQFVSSDITEFVFI